MEPTAKTATNGNNKPKPAPTAKPKAGKKPMATSAKAAKVPIAKAALEALAKKHGKARHVPTGKIVEVRTVRTGLSRDVAKLGYDARVAFPDGKAMLVSAFSLKPA